MRCERPCWLLAVRNVLGATRALSHLAAGAVDLASKVAAEDAVDKGRLVEAFQPEAVSPPGLLRVDAGLEQLGVLRREKEENFGDVRNGG